MKFINDNSPIPALGGVENDIVCFNHKKAIRFSYDTQPTLKFLFKGQIQYLVRDKRITLNPGQIILFEEGDNLEVIIDEKAEGISIFFDRGTSDYASSAFLQSPMPLIECTLKYRLNSFNSHISTGHLSVKILKRELMLFTEQLNELLNTLEYKKDNTKIDVLYRTMRAKSIIEDSFTNKISTDSLADEVAMSKYHLIRKFKQLFKTSPQQYQILKRIELAKELMRNPSLSLTEISSLCGFGNLFHFSKMFKIYTSFSPLKFRQLNYSVP
ncbi:MAG: AraC family transcriptional regulator [Fulvivirga sp.]|uniref:AraC family transcriptional regulator n=1 Tax=Fulvivirga sp. TaxID=1931237 RepID=UPI0032EAFE5A